VAEKCGLVGFSGVKKRRVALAKVHNCEQLRWVYEEALAGAGLSPEIIVGYVGS
jgi:hypothetical protein